MRKHATWPRLASSRCHSILVNSQVLPWFIHYGSLWPASAWDACDSRGDEPSARPSLAARRNFGVAEGQKGFAAVKLPIRMTRPILHCIDGYMKETAQNKHAQITGRSDKFAFVPALAHYYHHHLSSKFIVSISVATTTN